MGFLSNDCVKSYARKHVDLDSSAHLNHHWDVVMTNVEGRLFPSIDSAYCGHDTSDGGILASPVVIDILDCMQSPRSYLLLYNKQLMDLQLSNGASW